MIYTVSMNLESHQYSNIWGNTIQMHVFWMSVVYNYCVMYSSALPTWCLTCPTDG